MGDMLIYSSSQKAPRRKARRIVNAWRAYLPMLLAGLFLGMVLAAGIWLWRNLNDPQTLPFHQIHISGQFQHLQVEQLRQIVQKQLHGGFFTVNLTSIQQSLLANPWVEEVAIRRVPGKLYVTVREYHPVARWNEQYLINAKGQLFPAPPDAAVDLPRLQGTDGQEAIVFANYKQINQLLKPLQLQARQITLDNHQSWELVLSNDITVTIGREEVLARVQRLVQWYPQIVNDKVSAIAHIDLRYSNSIAVGFRI